MRLVLFISVLFFLNSESAVSQDSIRIFGKVTDFNAHPIDSVSVRLKNKNFDNLYEVLTDKNGNFSFNVLKGSYYCLYAIKLSDYGKTKLEYWAWNIPAFEDLEINPQYERMEIYGIQAFEPQVGPWNTYMLYFRPMSLTKSIAFQGNENKKDREKRASAANDTINIAPLSITADELQVSVNDIKCEIVNITRVPEYARGAYLYGYLIQILKPKDESKMDNKYDKITIVLHSKETGESGKGEHFINKIK